MERVKAGDPAAMLQMGAERYEERDYDGAVEYFTKAAELGDARAHYLLGRSYHEGEGVEKDEEKEVYHLEEAAIGGHPYARYNLGIHEDRNGNIEKATTKKLPLRRTSLGSIYAEKEQKMGKNPEISAAITSITLLNCRYDNDDITTRHAFPRS